jgi:hypothetical protein
MSKTILFDFNNTVMRKLFNKNVCDHYAKDVQVNYDYWKFLVFETVYKTFCANKGTTEVILAVDNGSYWRRNIWSGYKASRKEKREMINVDWKEVWKHYHEIQEDFQKYLPFKMLNVNMAEADDIIGTLTLRSQGEVVIISTDCDFQQLCRKNVKVFNPIKWKKIEHPNPGMFLLEQCILGQKKDDIPNIKTPLDYPEGKRTPPMGKKAFEKIMVYGWKKWLEEKGLVERFKINKTLIDFREIPEDIQNAIVKQYREYKLPEPSNIIQFFQKNGWPDYLDNICQTENKLLSLY